jgi:Amt family ammonium transporter
MLNGRPIAESHRSMWCLVVWGLVLLAPLMISPAVATAQDAAATTETADAPAPEGDAATTEAAPDPMEAMNANSSALRVAVDTVWVLVAGMLVFWMNAGFALVESGLCRAKNCSNILAKNFIVFAISSVSFWVIGWGLMFGDGTPYYGTEGLWFVGGADNSPALGSAYAAMNPFSTDTYEGVYNAINWTPVPLFAKFFFQLVFAGTAATIVSGAVAERIKFVDFLIFSVILVAVMYPVTGHWIWGGGFLSLANFRDFAGSTVVHSVGGWAALAGILVLGPRLGKFSKEGKAQPIPGHSLTSAALGVLILWLGWFGFNPGSTMAAAPTAISHVLVATNLGAAMGTITAMITAWVLLGKPELTMILNGCLAGLVAVTAPCAFVTLQSAAIIGAVGGVLVVFGVLAFDRLKIDDPVGALSVHLLNGIWGTLALGLFYDYDTAFNIAALPPFDASGAQIPLEQWSMMDQFMIQLQGVAYVGVFTFVVSLILWIILKVTLGIRVSQVEEVEGLDICEHGNNAYPDFVTTQPERMTGFSHAG